MPLPLNYYTIFKQKKSCKRLLNLAGDFSIYILTENNLKFKILKTSAGLATQAEAFMYYLYHKIPKISATKRVLKIG